MDCPPPSGVPECTAPTQVERERHSPPTSTRTCDIIGWLCFFVHLDFALIPIEKGQELGTLPKSVG